MYLSHKFIKSLITTSIIEVQIFQNLTFTAQSNGRPTLHPKNFTSDTQVYLLLIFKSNAC
jgi:hypothetical protein